MEPDNSREYFIYSLDKQMYSDIKNNNNQFISLDEYHDIKPNDVIFLYLKEIRHIGFVGYIITQSVVKKCSTNKNKYQTFTNKLNGYYFSCYKVIILESPIPFDMLVPFFDGNGTNMKWKRLITSNIQKIIKIKLNGDILHKMIDTNTVTNNNYINIENTQKSDINKETSDDDWVTEESFEEMFKNKIKEEDDMYDYSEILSSGSDITPLSSIYYESEEDNKNNDIVENVSYSSSYVTESYYDSSSEEEITKNKVIIVKSESSEENDPHEHSSTYKIAYNSELEDLYESNNSETTYDTTEESYTDDQSDEYNGEIPILIMPCSKMNIDINSTSVEKYLKEHLLTCCKCSIVNNGKSNFLQTLAVAELKFTHIVKPKHGACKSIINSYWDNKPFFPLHCEEVKPYIHFYLIGNGHTYYEDQLIITWISLQ